MNDEQTSGMWERGDPYEQYVGRWSRQVAPLFLTWLNLPAGCRWLDVRCGTGALAAAIADSCAPVSVTGIDPSEGFLQKAKAHLAGRVSLQKGHAAAIPLEDAAVDVVVSGLVLNFVSDPPAALAEMARVTRDGGVLGAYVWDYAERMELMRFFWDAATALDPAAAKNDEGVRFSLCRPEALVKLFESAALQRIEATAIDIATPFTNFEAYWQPFLGAQGTAPAYVATLPEPTRAHLRDRLQERLPTQVDGSISLTARAWAVRAYVDR